MGKYPEIPRWALRTNRSSWQVAIDAIFAPLRMVVLPDHVSENLHLTSLRAERFAKVLPQLQGAVLDIGAGDNQLLKLYKESNGKNTEDSDAVMASVGVDVVDWGADCTIIKSSNKLPFSDNIFDVVSFVACINHIPERETAMLEAARVLRPGGKVVVTMINRFVGELGHKLWWYSEDKHRHVDEDEVMGMDQHEVEALFHQAGIKDVKVERFFYGLNYLYVATV
jgi:SAM-dependent methyltransferase